MSKNRYKPTKSQRKRKRRKEIMDKALMEFVTICAKCIKYEDGRCPIYNVLMDDMVKYGKIPSCSHAEFETEE